MAYPAEYGFLENTLANDGDPLDILVIGTERTYPGCIVPARIIGYLKVIDRGFEDYKLISVVDVDPRYEEVKELTDLSRFILDEIKNFFENYKTLQKQEVKVGKYHGKEEALELIEECKHFSEDDVNTLIQYANLSRGNVGNKSILTKNPISSVIHSNQPGFLLCLT